MKKAAHVYLMGSDRERERKIRGSIVRMLKQYGPLTVRGLAAHIPSAGEFALTQCARQLLDMGRVTTRNLVNPEKTRTAARLLWLLPTDQDRPLAPDFDGVQAKTRVVEPEKLEEAVGILPPLAPLKLITGVTEADLAWQAYWRIPRAERRGFPPPESGHGIAGWDGARTLDQLAQGGLSEGEGRP